METENEVPPENKPAEEDVEMKNVAEDVKEEKTEEAKEEAKEDSAASPLTSIILFFHYQPVNALVIQQNLQLLERAVSTLDPRFTYRVLKMSNLRKLLSAQVLVQAVRQFYPPDHPSVLTLQTLLDKVGAKLCVYIMLTLGIFCNGSR